MRVTTQMLNESARKAGLPVNRTSLLNYINSDKNSNTNSLLQSLSKSSSTSSVADTENRKNYEKLGKEADRLTDAAAGLMKAGDDNLFTQAKESGDTQKICENIENLLKSYNSTLKALKNTSGTLNDFYRQMLSDAPEEAKESLANIGITFDKDGTASVDTEKLKKADLETLEGLFGSKSSFMSKLHFVSTRIADNADANLESAGNTYSSKGRLYSEGSGSKYNFLG